MRYLPHTRDEIKLMLEAIGLRDSTELFSVIPKALRLHSPLDLPRPLAEDTLLRHLQDLGQKNQTVDSVPSFLGGGAYNHYTPTAIADLISRGEFLTAYTPYQPEISQGTLQAIFEFQTMIASLTGMDLANASNYDGASALAEASLMALRLGKNKKRKILLSSTILPDYKEVVRTYLQNLDFELEEIPYQENGRVDLQVLREKCDSQTAGFCVQSPNALGVIEDFSSIEKIVHGAEALLIGCFSEAVSLGFLKPMGALGADIVVGEGASLGNALNFGGPYLGLFATKEAYVRQMPGRLVGETTDANHKRGFVLVLSTREQHIRREKATSNICTNQALCALVTTIYLSLLGPHGFKKIAQTNYDHACYLREGLVKTGKVKRKFSSPHFNEFVISLPRSAKRVCEELQQRGISGGISMEGWGVDLENALLVCATEMNSRAQMDHYIQTMQEIL